MTGPLNPFATSPFAQPAPVPAASTNPAPAPVMSGAAPLGPLAGLGTAAQRASSGVSMGGLVGYLLLIVPTGPAMTVPKMHAKVAGETQLRVPADVLVIRTPDGRTGPVTITCPGGGTAAPRVLSHHADADGNPDPARPFIHNPAAGQFLAFDGMAIYGGALADGLADACNPAKPEVTMIAAYVIVKPGKTYFVYADPKPSDMDEIKAVANAWFARRGQFG